MNFMARPRISNINVRLRLDEAWQNEDGGCFETVLSRISTKNYTPMAEIKKNRGEKMAKE